MIFRGAMARSRIPLLLVLAVGASLPLWASELPYVKRGALQRQGRAWVEQAECGAPVREGARLVVRADMGSILVKTGPNDRMECTVRLGVYSSSEAEAKSYLSRYELSLRRLEGGGVSLTGTFNIGGRHSRLLPVVFNIRVPVRFNLDLETEGGSVEVERLEGELRAVTAGGDIRTGNVTGPVRVETAGGGIELGNIGQRLEASTAGGGIRVGDVKGNATLETSGGEIVAGWIEGTVRAETAGGDILLHGASGPVVAETAGGQIQIGRCRDSIRAQTAGGSIYLDGARGMVRAETAGGSIDLLQMQSAVRAATAAGPIVAEFNATRATFAASDLETSVGDVKIYLPPDLPLTINAVIDEAAGHKILSDFPLNIQGDKEDFCFRTLRGHGALHGGGEELRIHTVIGNIEIRKLDRSALEQLKLRQEAYWKRWQGRDEFHREREERPRERRQEREPE